MSSSSTHDLGISKAVDYEKVSIQERFEVMEGGIKPSVCMHKAKGVQGV